MKTKPSFSLLAALAAASLTSGALAQTSSPAPATPSTEISATTPLPTPNEIVYVPRLPTPADITKGAQVKSISVERISQTNSQVDVVYRTAEGKIDTTSYRLLADAGTAGPTTTSSVAVPSSPAPAVAIAGTTTPSTVVYTPAPATRVYYYPDYYYDYPGYWYPPVSFGIGIGYRSYGYYGYRGGYRVGYRGGFHSGYHGGGWHR